MGREWSAPLGTQTTHSEMATLLACIAMVLGLATLVLAVLLRRARADKKQLQRYMAKLQGAKQSLKKHAFFDPLTGLPNRLLLVDRFQLALQHAKRNQQQFAVLMVDLNKFKAINDTFGHAAGDTVLVTVAQRLVSVVRASDTVARLGGDEFVLIIHSVSERKPVLALGRKLMDLLAQPVTLETGTVVSLGGSIGFAWYPSDGDNLKDILEVADQAMYFCKTSGLMPL